MATRSSARTLAVPVPGSIVALLTICYRALFLAAALASGPAMIACGAGSQESRASSAKQERPLKVDPLIDLVAAAGLVWLVELSPRALVSSPVFGPAVTAVVSNERFDAFAKHHGGVDVRLAERLVIAGDARTTLLLARVPFDGAGVEGAFALRAEAVLGRASEGGVTRLWGTVRGAREQIALLGREVIAVEMGPARAESGDAGVDDELRGPLRAAIYFAQEKLHRSLPALRAQPLMSAAARAGEAPVRMFAPGPFEGEWAAGAAGLLRATTAVALTARPVSTTNAADAANADATKGGVAIRLLLLGAWGRDARLAADRLEAAYGVLSDEAIGRLTGFDHPLVGPTVTGDAEALELDVTVDAVALASGIHVAGDASLAEMMAY